MPLSRTKLCPPNSYLEGLTPDVTGDGAFKEAGRSGEVVRVGPDATAGDWCPSQQGGRRALPAVPRTEDWGVCRPRDQPPGLGQNKSYR